MVTNDSDAPEVMECIGSSGNASPSVGTGDSGAPQENTEGEDPVRDLCQEKQPEPVEHTDAASAAFARNSTKSRLVFGFNTFFVEFLIFVKGSDDSMKRRIKKAYRVIDRKSDSYLVWLSRAVATAPEKYAKVLCDPENSAADVLDSATGLQIAEGISVSEVWMKRESRSAGWLASLALHVRLLAFVARLFAELCDEDSIGHPRFLDDLFSRAVTGVGAASSGAQWDHVLKDIIDDDVRAGLECVMRSAEECRDKGDAESGSSSSVAKAYGEIRDAGMVGGAAGLEAALESLKDSSLGKIAMELSESVDKDALRKELMGGDGGIEAVLKGLMTGESTGMIGAMLSKVSGVVAGKMEDGSLNLEELMRDASKVMGAFNGSLAGMR